jgi:hypothetical protein
MAGADLLLIDLPGPELVADRDAYSNHASDSRIRVPVTRMRVSRSMFDGECLSGPSLKLNLIADGRDAEVLR